MKKYTQKEGFVVMSVVVIFLFISLGASLALGSIMYNESAIVRNNAQSTQSIHASESLQEDIFLRIREGRSVSPVSTLSLNGASAEAVIVQEGGRRRVTSVGDTLDRIRKTEMIISEGTSTTDVGFLHGVQTGAGGINLQGSASVEGSLYSSGPIEGGWSARVTGSAISAGPDGFITGFMGGKIGGYARAHTIENSVVEGACYFQNIIKTQWGSGCGSGVGDEHPNSPDMPELPLPISDEEIEEWKSEAEMGGVYDGPCTIGGVSDVSIGNVRVDCDLNIGGSARVMLTGPLWVRGNITFEGSARVYIDPSLEGQTITVVADNPANRMNSGRIGVGGSASIQGAGEGSYVLLVSQNESAENGGSTTAIDVGGGGPHNDIILFAGHGLIHHGGSASVPVGVTGYRVVIGGSARVRYQDAAASLTFPVSGVGGEGGYTLESIREIQ